MYLRRSELDESMHIINASLDINDVQAQMEPFLSLFCNYLSFISSFIHHHICSHIFFNKITNYLRELLISV